MNIKSIKKLTGLFMGLVTALTISTTAFASKDKIADVSQWQGDIQWDKAADDLEMAIIRVQQGSTNDESYYLDTKKDQNASGAKAANVPFGEYAYSEFTSTDDATQEATEFYNNSSKDTKFYVLDNEARATETGNEQEYVNAWLKQMRKLTDKPIIYYSYQSFIEANNMDYSKFDGSWVAKYSSEQPTAQTDLWQYSQSGTVNGIDGDVDLNTAVDNNAVKSWYANAEKNNKAADKQEQKATENKQTDTKDKNDNKDNKDNQSPVSAPQAVLSVIQGFLLVRP